MVSRGMEILGGIVIAVLGAGLTYGNWYLAFHECRYYRMGSFVAPGLVVAGLALVCFPSYKRERISRGEDLRDKRGLELLTPTWWGVLVLAAVCGLANYLLMRSS